VTLIRPPAVRSPEVEAAPSTEVLFKEARRRQRRRWTVAVAVVLLAAIVATIGYGASGNGGHTSQPRATAPARPGAGPTGPTAHAPSSAPLTAPPSLERIAFFSPTLGYGLFRQTEGGFCELAVARTTDGGRSFAVPVPVAPCDRFDITTSAGLAFDDHGDGFLYGTSLFVTHDGGTSWQPDPQPGPVVSVEALGSSIWMLEARCPQPVSQTRSQRCPVQVSVSTDGGRTWAQTAAQRPSASTTGRIGRWWGALVRVSVTASYVVAAPPTPTSAPGRTTSGTVPLSFTVDGGRTWAERTIPCGADAQRAILSAAPSGTLIAVCGWSTGIGGQQRKAVLVSTDEGTTWSKTATCAPFACALSSGYLGVVDAVSSSTAYAIGGRGRLLETTDGGAEWSADQVTGGGGGPTDVVFFGPSDGIASTTGRLWHTTDAGQSWSGTTPGVHEAVLPTIRRGHIDAATLPAPIKVVAPSIEARTTVPLEAPFTLPPSLSATATVARNRYSVSLYECPHLLRFGTPGIGKGTCGGVAQRFGSFGGERQVSAIAARAAVRMDVTRPPGCPAGRRLVHEAAQERDVVRVVVAGTGVLCALAWKHGGWTVEVVGALTPREATAFVMAAEETIGHVERFPAPTGVLIVDKAAGGIHVLARWSRGAIVGEASAYEAGHYPTPTGGGFSVISDMMPVSR